MRFKAEINLDNAAFENPEELGKLLKEIADKVAESPLSEQAKLFGACLVVESNGNACGKWRIIND